MKTKTIYLAMALTHASEDFKHNFNITLRSQLKKANHMVLDFVGLYNAHADNVYLSDLNCVREADLMIAICDEPSIGLGMEIMERITIKKPLLLCWKRGSKITRMVIGAVIVEKCFYCQYNSIDDIIRVVNEYKVILAPSND